MEVPVRGHSEQVPCLPVPSNHRLGLTPAALEDYKLMHFYSLYRCNLGASCLTGIKGSLLLIMCS